MSFKSSELSLDCRGYHRINSTGELVHRFLYKLHNPCFDPSWQVHHIDENKLNNEVSNLIGLPEALHRRIHEIGWVEKRRLSRYEIELHLEWYLEIPGALPPPPNLHDALKAFKAFKEQHHETVQKYKELEDEVTRLRNLAKSKAAKDRNKRAQEDRERCEAEARARREKFREEDRKFRLRKKGLKQR